MKTKTQTGWTAEVKYQSAERKMTTGESTIHDGAGEYIGSVLNEHAALVAAAPDLLAALEEANELISHAKDCPYRHSGECLCVRSRIVAAIVKAEGSIP